MLVLQDFIFPTISPFGIDDNMYLKFFFFNIRQLNTPPFQTILLKNVFPVSISLSLFLSPFEINGKGHIGVRYMCMCINQKWYVQRELY